MLPAAAARANLSHAVAQVWSATGWATTMWEVASHDPETQTIRWGKGGFQDARAANQGAAWYLENAFEFLDAPNEYYYSAETKQLYLYYNGTGMPPPDASIVATKLQTLVSLQVSAALLPA